MGCQGSRSSNSVSAYTGRDSTEKDKARETERERESDVDREREACQQRAPKANTHGQSAYDSHMVCSTGSRCDCKQA